MNRLQQRILAAQEPDSNPNATRGLVYSSPAKPSTRASGRGTSGRGTTSRETSRRERSGKRTSAIGTLGRLLPPADSPSSCCSISTSEVFPAAPTSRRVGTTGRGFWGVRSPKNCSPLRVWVSGVRGHGGGSGVCGHGAGTVGCGHAVCSPITWPSSRCTVGLSSTMVSSSSADVWNISPRPIVQGSLPSSSTLSSSSSSFSLSSSSSSYS